MHLVQFKDFLLTVHILYTIKNEKIFLKHIIESIENVEDFTKEISISDFINSVLIQDGVIRRLEIIGEAVKNLPMEFREKLECIEKIEDSIRGGGEIF